MLLIVVVFTAVLMFGSDDAVAKRYIALNDARADQVFEKEWLPDILSLSSRKIRATNNLDLNVADGNFLFEAADFNFFTARLMPIQDNGSRYSRLVVKI